MSSSRPYLPPATQRSSVEVTISLPLHIARSIRHNDFDKAHLSQLVVDAVKQLPEDFSTYRSSDPATTPPIAPAPLAPPDAGLLTPATLSTYDLDALTIVDGDGDGEGYTTRATSPPMYTPATTASIASHDESLGIRRPEKDFTEKSFVITVIHEHRKVYQFHVKNTMLVADVLVEIEQRGGPPMANQRLVKDKKALRFEDTLRAADIKAGKKLDLLELSGICFQDSDLDFWVHVRGSVAERKIPVHTKTSTTTSDLGMALFELLAPQAPHGRRQLRFQGQVVYACGSEVPRTVESLGVTDGSIIPLELIIFPY